MKQLSFEFYYKFLKKILIISSILSNFAILVFIIYYMFWGTNYKILAFCFLMIYVIISSVYNYYLIKSKSIKYDSNSILIQIKPNNWEVISLKRIIKIKRTYHYFYTIYYKSSEASIEKVIFFISPNPSFSKSEKVKEIFNFAEKLVV